ncbi:MAG: hypothetical protein IJX52_01210 [Oscillibacter sp.]|nr:hypothetical protein [Oscillibacter sp.]
MKLHTQPKAAKTKMLAAHLKLSRILFVENETAAGLRFSSGGGIPPLK